MHMHVPRMKQLVYPSFIVIVHVQLSYLKIVVVENDTRPSKMMKYWLFWLTTLMQSVSALDGAFCVGHLPAIVQYLRPGCPTFCV